ncbi:MSC_0620 family F1-like ATPase-associated subunit [Mycoplasma sp. Z386]
MKKNNKDKHKLLATFALPLVITPAAFFASADPEPNSGTSSTNGTANDKEKPAAKKQKSPQFDTFAKISKDAIKTGLQTAVDIAIKNLADEQNKLKVDEKISFEDKAKKNYYLETLKNFLEANKEKMASDPNGNKLNVTFPNVFSQKDNFKRGTVTFEGKTYDNVIFNETSDNTSYTKAIGTKGKQQAEKEESNFYTSTEVNNYLKKYNDSLKERITDVFYNEKDIPDIEFTPETISKGDGSTVSALVAKPPEGFTTWDDYFKSKYENRFTAFDLDQNKTDDEQQEDQKQKEQTDNSIPEIPTIDDVDSQPSDQIVDVKPYNPKEYIEKLPILGPEVLTKNLDKTAEEISSEFEAEPISENYFFFNNPINTRFEYKVIAIEKDTNSDNYIATIRIQDLVKPEYIRLYKTFITIPKNKGFQKIYEEYVKSVRNIFVNLYKSLQLDEKIDVDALESNQLKTRLLTMINVVTQELYYNKTFVDKQSQILSPISVELNKSNNLNNASVIEDGLNLLDVQLISSLKTSRIQFREFYSILPEGYEKELLRYEQLLKNQPELLKKVNDKFQKYHANTDIINKLFENMRKDISVIKKHAGAKTFNTIKWYEEYLALLSKIAKQFNIVKSFLKDEKPETDEKNKEENSKNFNSEYTNANKLLQQEFKSQNLFLTVIGTILGTAGLGAVALASANQLNSKTKGNKSTLKANIAIIILSTIVIVFALALILFGTIGGI